MQQCVIAVLKQSLCNHASCHIAQGMHVQQRVCWQRNSALCLVVTAAIWCPTLASFAGSIGQGLLI